MADVTQVLSAPGGNNPAVDAGWTPPASDAVAMPAGRLPPKEDSQPIPEPSKDSQWRSLMNVSIRHPLVAAKLAQSIAFQPFHKLERIDPRKVPDMRGLGIINPRILAHVYNDGVAPFVEQSMSPGGLLVGKVLGGLRVAQEASLPAKVMYKSILGLFGAQMAWAFGSKDIPEIARVAKDPKATSDQVGAAVAHTIADGTGTLLSAFEMLHKAGPAGAAAVESAPDNPMAPQEMADHLRAQSEAATTPVEKIAFAHAADTLEDLASHPTGPENEVSATEAPSVPPAPAEATETGTEGPPASIPNYMDEPAKDHIRRLMARLSDMMYVVGQEHPEAKFRRTAKEKIEGLKQELADTKKTMREQDRQMREETAAIRKELLDRVKELPIGERGRFTQAIADAMNRPALGQSPEGMYRRAMHVMVRMMDRFDEVEREGLIGDINKSVKKALDSPSVDVAFKRRIERMVGRVNFANLSDQRRAELAATRAYIARGGEGVPQDVLAQLDMLAQTPANDLPMSALRTLKDRVDLLAKLGRTMVKSREALYAYEKSSLIDDLKKGKARGMDDSPVEKTPGQQNPWFKQKLQDAHNQVIRRLNSAAKLGRSLLARDVVLDMLDGDANYRGPISRIFGGRIDLDYNAEMNLRQAYYEPLERVLKDNDYSTTELERVSIYAIAKQEGGVGRLEDSGVSQRTIDHVNATITPKEMLLYTTARGVFDNSIFPAVQKFMRDVYNIDVKKTDNYWPFQRDPDLVAKNTPKATTTSESGEAVEFDEMATVNQLNGDFRPRATTQVEKGMTIERVPEARGAVRLNALDVINRHVNQAAHLLATQRDTKMLGEIARQKWFEEKYGKLGQDYILKFLDSVARDAAPAGSTTWRWLDSLMRRSSVGVLGLRVLSQAKHLPNLAFSLYNVKPSHLVNALVELHTPEGRAFIQKNFSEIAQRAGGEPAIAEIGDGSVWKKVQSGSFFIEKYLDAVDSRMTVLGAYFQELEAKGIDPKQYATLPIDPEAQRIALVKSRQTVTSPLRKDVPQAISRGTIPGGNMSLSRALFQFQNTVLKQWSFMTHEIYDMGLKKLNVHQFTFATLAFLGMIAGETSIIEANKKLLSLRRQGRDQDSFAKEMGAEILRRIPFVGNIAAAAMYGETGVPVVDSVTDALHSAGDLARDKNKFGGKLTPKEKRQEKAKLLGAAAELSGVPGAGTVEQLIKRNIDHSNR